MMDSIHARFFIMSILLILSKKTSMNDELSEKVIGAAFRVHNELGFGFLESVHEKLFRLR